MQVDMEIVRKVMRSLALEVPGLEHALTETFILSPIRNGLGSDFEADHVDLLKQVGWIRTSHDIRMRGSDRHPVTYRSTGEGVTWVRRAWNDEEWMAALEEAREVLESAAAPD